MAREQRRLWTGDWQAEQEPEPATVELPREPQRASVAKDAAVAKVQEKRTRAWATAAAVGAGVFAFSFGYMYGAVRNGTDPGLKPAASQTAIQPNTQTQPQFAQPDQGGFDPGASGADPSASGADQQGLPPVTTRQS